MKIAVGIATAGRREILSETLLEIGRQTRAPDRLIVCPARSEDCDSSLLLPVPIEVVSSPIGSCAQRNAIIEAAADADWMVFFDDDFFPAPDFLALLEAEILARPSAAVITGTPLADGILGLGLSPQEARLIIASRKPEPAIGRMSETHKGYGCNMAVNMALVRRCGARFDEALPLYAWLEDEDFSRSLARQGAILKSRALQGVHLGVKSGRTPGLRLGYSQVANPVYLWRKGSFSASRAFRQIGRNVVANLIKSFRPEPWVDRLGRLRGNALAFSDLAANRLTPARILDLPAQPQLGHNSECAHAPATPR